MNSHKIRCLIIVFFMLAGVMPAITNNETTVELHGFKQKPNQECTTVPSDMPTWGDPVLLNTAPGGNIHKDIHLQDDGRLTVYYTPSDRTNDLRFVSSYDEGEAWSESQNAAIDSFSDSNEVWFTDVCRSGMGYHRIAMFSDESGVCHRIWVAGSKDTQGDEFNAPSLVDEYTGDTVAQIEPSVAVENSGLHHVVFQTKQFGDDWHIAYCSGNGYDWDEPVDLGSGVNPEIVTTPYGDLVVTYEESLYLDSSHPEIFVRTKESGEQWSSPSTIQEYVGSFSPAGCAEACNTIAMDSRNNVHMIYQSDQSIYYTWSSDYVEWSSPQLVRSSVGGDSRPGICVTEEGNIATVFNDESNGGMTFVLGDFAPDISNVQHEPEDPVADETVTISATIQDPAGIYSAKVQYSINEGSWQEAQMTNSEGDVYETDIGPFDIGDSIRYNVSASDDSSLQNLAKDDNDGSCYQMTIGDPDTTGPTIEDLSRTPLYPIHDDVINISATITDPSGIKSAFLKYSIDGGSWTNVSMSNTEQDTYEAQIGPYSNDTQIRYYFKAIDDSLNENPSIKDNSGEYYTVTVGLDPSDIDETPPSLIISEPINQTYHAPPVSVQWEANDPESSITTVNLAMDGEEIRSTSENEGVDTISDLDDGEHVITITAENAIGLTTERCVVIYVDTVQPEISIISPTEHQVYDNNEFTLSWVADDSSGACGEIDSYEIFVDSVSYSVTEQSHCDIDNLQDGSHFLRVVVYDTAGNYADDTVTIWIDVGAPTVTIQKPIQSSTWNKIDSSVVELSCIANDDAGMVEVVAKITKESTSSSIEIQLTKNEDTGTWEGQWDISSVSAGAYTIEFIAYDLAEHNGSDSVSCTIMEPSIGDIIMANLHIIAPICSIVGVIIGIAIKLRN